MTKKTKRNISIIGVVILGLCIAIVIFRVVELINDPLINLRGLID